MVPAIQRAYLSLILWESLKAMISSGLAVAAMLEMIASNLSAAENIISNFESEGGAGQWTSADL